MVPALSVIVATHNRAQRLERMLRSLDAAIAQVPHPVEVVIVDNASTDGTPAVVQRWVASAAARVGLVEHRRGKARALNRALPVSRAPLLAFTDDDVEIGTAWVKEVLGFFDQHPQYSAAMGRVRLPPEVVDPAVYARAARYGGTIPLYDQGDSVCDVEEMYGCNMVLRRAAFDRVGLFNEQLGPGASGLSEDTDLSARIRRAGLRIGYIPDAIVYHELDPWRLTRGGFRDFHVRLARGRAATEPPQLWYRHLGRLIDAALSVGWWSLARRPQRRTHAYGRLVEQRELLRLRWAAQHRGVHPAEPSHGS